MTSIKIEGIFLSLYSLGLISRLSLTTSWDSGLRVALPSFSCDLRDSLVDSVIAEEHMPNVLSPRIGNVIHHFHSNSVDENLATGHTYWQGKLGNIVSVG